MFKDYTVLFWMNSVKSGSPTAGDGPFTSSVKKLLEDGWKFYGDLQSGVVKDMFDTKVYFVQQFIKE